MSKKYSQSKISTQLRKIHSITNLIKTVQFITRIYKIGMLQCAQIGSCPSEGMQWLIASYMVNMPLPILNRLWRQFCGVFQRGLNEISTTTL